VDVTIGSILASSWFQYGFVLVAIVSAAVDKRATLKALPAKLSAWWTARRAGKTVTETPTQRTACENRRTTLVGIRHKASELPAGEEREKALTLCDEMDKLAARLWPEAA
jgi:hypothetical protein